MATRDAPFRREQPDRSPNVDQAEVDAEEARRRAAAAVDEQVRRRIGARVDRMGSASPYDLLADALLHTVADGLIEALVSPDFEVALRARGYAVVPVTEDAPGAPEDWLQDAADLAAGAYRDPLELIDELWGRAWRAGHEAAAGGTVPEDPPQAE